MVRPFVSVLVPRRRSALTTCVVQLNQLPVTGLWGSPTTPAGTNMCPTTGWVNGTQGANGANWPITLANGTAVNFSTSTIVGGYWPNTPYPCWANTAPTSYAIPPGALTYNGYSVADVTGTTQVPHFLDFSSVLYKDVNGQVHRQQIPAGRCLPGNLVNVRTSAIQYFAAAPSVTPVYPKAKDVAYPTGANQIYTTTNDDSSQPGNGMTWYTPDSPVPTPLNMTGDGSAQPATLSTIRVYFALNYGLRNALDNACDGRSQSSSGNCVNGGYYVSNLTTALLGDSSKGLGRATYAIVKLCHSPTSTLDRPWRKRSGDAINNKQCMDVKQLLFGADAEKLNSPNVGVVGTPNFGVVGGEDIMLLQPLPAQTGLAVNNVPYTNFTNGKFSPLGAASVISAYTTNTAAALNVPTVSPVAFCRPAADTTGTQASGINPSKAAGVWFWNASYCTVSKTNLTAVDCYSNCVMNGTSMSSNKGNNVNLNDPSWYTVDIVLSRDMPKGNYFARVFVLDANMNYLGFGSSAGGANLTNTASQNYFFVDRWASWRSPGVIGGVADIRAGAAGCSALSLTVATIFLLREVRASRLRRARATEIVPEQKQMADLEPVKADLTGK